MFGEVMAHSPSGNEKARTLRASVTLTGIGLHQGQPVTLKLSPAPAGTGILFRRTDLLVDDGRSQSERLRAATIHASPAAVTQTTLGTVIANEAGAKIATVEHLMAALAGAGIDHAICELDGPEVPIMDGSSAPFTNAIARIGTRALPDDRRALRIDAPIRAEIGDAWAEITPLEEGEPLGCPLDVTVDYPDRLIGRQHLMLEGSRDAFTAEITAARTFCYLADVEAMRAAGLARGGSLENAIVVADGAVLNEEGLRFDGEFVRHKALDLIGDLHLLGRPLLGRLTAYKPGHALNTKLAAAIAASPDTALVTVPIARRRVLASA